MGRIGSTWITSFEVKIDLDPPQKRENHHIKTLFYRVFWKKSTKKTVSYQRIPQARCFRAASDAERRQTRCGSCSASGEVGAMRGGGFWEAMRGGFCVFFFVFLKGLFVFFLFKSQIKKKVKWENSCHVFFSCLLLLKRKVSIEISESYKENEEKHLRWDVPKPAVFVWEWKHRRPQQLGRAPRFWRPFGCGGLDVKRCGFATWNEDVEEQMKKWEGKPKLFVHLRFSKLRDFIMIFPGVFHDFRPSLRCRWGVRTHQNHPIFLRWLRSTFRFHRQAMQLLELLRLGKDEDDSILLGVRWVSSIGSFFLVFFFLHLFFGIFCSATRTLALPWSLPSRPATWLSEAAFPLVFSILPKGPAPFWVFFWRMSNKSATWHGCFGQM